MVRSVRKTFILFFWKKCDKCGGDISQGSEDPYTERIQCLYKSNVGSPVVYIFRDTKTGYEYMFVDCRHNGGVVRLDEKE